jgi:predicted phage gp36 major capsid-like protein
MKKIKSIKQLQYQKKLIKKHQTELEEKIRSNWKELKERLKPVNITKDAIESILRKKVSNVMNDGGIIKSSLSYGIALLAGKLAETTGEKFSKILTGRWFQKN